MTSNQIAFNKNLIAEREAIERERANKAQEQIADMKNQISKMDAQTKQGQLFLDFVSNPFIKDASGWAGDKEFIPSTSETGISYLDNATIWNTGSQGSETIRQVKDASQTAQNFGRMFRDIAQGIQALGKLLF